MTSVLRGKAPSGTLSSNDQRADLLEHLQGDPWAGPGPVIRELRRGHGLRLKDLAERTRLSLGYISRLERNEAGGDNPSIANLEIIARALAIPLAVLIGPHAQQTTTATIPVETLIGREILLAVTYRQPITLPVLERVCAHVGDIYEIAVALEQLIARCLIRRLPPSAPGRPVFYVTA